MTPINKNKNKNKNENKMKIHISKIEYPIKKNILKNQRCDFL